MSKEISIEHNGDIYIVKSKYDYDLYVAKLNKDKEIERLRKREKKWEKWTTEKEILSTKMSEYLCKWRNIKREYKNQVESNRLKKQQIERLNNIIIELEKELNNLITFNQSNITCNHYTPDDWKDSKLIGNMLYKMKPVSFLAQELKDKLKELKEGKE